MHPPACSIFQSGPGVCSSAADVPVLDALRLLILAVPVFCLFLRVLGILLYFGHFNFLVSLKFSHVFTLTYSFFFFHFVLVSFDEQNFKFELVDVISLLKGVSLAFRIRSVAHLQRVSGRAAR